MSQTGGFNADWSPHRFVLNANRKWKSRQSFPSIQSVAGFVSQPSQYQHVSISPTDPSGIITCRQHTNTTKFCLKTWNSSGKLEFWFVLFPPPWLMNWLTVGIIRDSRSRGSLVRWNRPQNLSVPSHWKFNNPGVTWIAEPVNAYFDPTILDP
jgi:hypothetical protein